MRVAIVTPGFSAHPDDWAIPSLQNLFRALARQHELHLFSLRYPARGSYRFDNFTHYAAGGGQRFGWRSGLICARTAGAIVRQHRRRPFDLIHAFWADEPGLTAALAALVIKRPLIIRLGGWDLVDLPDINYGAQRIWSKRLMVRYALNKASAIQVNSLYQKKQCDDHRLPGHKVHLIPAGVDTDRFTPGQKKSLAAPVLVQAASLVPVKNQALLLEVLQKVTQVNPAISLNLAGAGPLESNLKVLADQLNITRNIVWHKKVAYPDMVRLYRQGHVYVQTSRHESQGMSVLEAMACGLPVVGTPVGVAPEVACQPAAWSAEVLAGQILSVLSTPDRYNDYSVRARQTVVSRFSLPVVVGQLTRLYRLGMTADR